MPLLSEKRYPKNTTTKILGIDSSSLGIAYSILTVKNGQPHLARTGKIDLTKKKGLPNKLEELHTKMVQLLSEETPTFVMIEKSIYVKNPDTFRTLSYIVGGLMAVASEGSDVDHVDPATWKAYFGYKNLSAKFKKDAKEKIGKGANKFCDSLRKSQTKRVILHNFPHFVLPEDDHDIADSCGVALYAWDRKVEPLNIEKSREISIDLEELARLGLTL